MKSKSKSLIQFLRSNYLTLLTCAGVVIGVIVGLLCRLRKSSWTDREIMYISFIGKLFLSMLKCIIIPLIIPSLITAVGSLDLRLSGKVGGRAVAYYLITTLLAVILGIILVTAIQPGVSKEKDKPAEDDLSKHNRNVTTADTMMDLIRNMFPPNIMQATLNQYRTKIIYPGNDSIPKEEWKVKGEWTNGTNILGLVVFSIVTGIAIASSGEEGIPLLNFFSSTSFVMMKITNWIIHLAPIGVSFLIAGQIIDMKDIGETFSKLGLYFATVLIGLCIHGILILPSIYAVFTRSLPFKFVGNMGNAIITAFGTGSSSATLPVTIKNLEEKNEVDPRISRFVLPIGATINMDGTALYEAVAAIFIAQFRNIDLGISEIASISITATAASIGAAGIPQAGLVTMVMVLATVGLPSEDVGLILAVDWLLDRFRTSINVLGDSIGAGIVHKFSHKELEQMDIEDNEMRMSEKMNGVNGKSNPAYESTSM